MKVTIEGLKIDGITTCIPENIKDLRTLGEEYGQHEVDRIIKSTGIEKIRVAGKGTCASDLCAEAARKLFNNLNIDPKEIDGIVFVTETPDYIIPASSVILQNRLGLSTACVAFDVNYGCSGYVYGVYLSSMLVSTGGCRKVLLLVGDVITPFVNQKDRSLRMILGDAGSASIISKGNNMFSFHIFTDGSGYQTLIVPAGGARIPRNSSTCVPTERENGNIRSDEDIFMNGLDVFNFAINEAPKSILAALEQHQWDIKDVQLFGLHQPNFLMIDFIRKKLKLKTDVVPVGMRETGNTGPASIPLLLTLQHKNFEAEDRLKRVVLSGFGIGLSCASVALTLESTLISDPIIYNQN